MLQFTTKDNSLIPLSELARQIPSYKYPGKVVNRATLRRWALNGVRGIKLETVTIGGGRYSSNLFVSEFIQKLSGSSPADPALNGNRRNCGERAGNATNMKEAS